MAHLFEPLNLRGVTLRNRIGVSPMCQYWAEDGVVSDWHLVHLGSRAVGGAGLVIAEATAVEARGRITPQDAGIWADKHLEPWARITHFLKRYGAVAGIQLAHAGRKGSTLQPWLRQSHDETATQEQGGWEVVAPSALPFREQSLVPHALTLGEIAEIQGAFQQAAERALAVGFEFLELHAAHGYLGHSFLSPLSNQRTDQYGGSFENRTRFVLETAALLRAVWPEHLPLAVRLSTTDWVEGGWTLEDSIALVRQLKAVGVDLIDCSSGFVVPGVTYPMAPGWQVSLSQEIRQQAAIPTAAVGQITEPAQADAIIQSGQADIVLLGVDSGFQNNKVTQENAMKPYSVDLLPLSFTRLKTAMRCYEIPIGPSMLPKL